MPRCGNVHSVRGMESTPTLHDFVLNLITNQDARLAFELDPEGALQNARLGDLTPADVQDVIPLVVDLTPVQGLLPAPLNTLDLGTLPVDPTAAAGQLQHLLHQLPIASGNHSASADVNVATTLGAITVEPATAGNDVFLTLDSAAAGGAGGLLGNGLPLGTGSGGLTGGDLTGGSLTTGVTGDLTGGLTSGVTGNLTGDLTSSLTGDLVGSLGGSLTGNLTGDLLGGVNGVVGGGSLGGLTGDLTSGITGPVSPAGDLTGDLPVTVSGTLHGVSGTVDSTVGTLTGGLGLGASAQADGDVHSGGLLGGLTDGLL